MRLLSRTHRAGKPTEERTKTGDTADKLQRYQTRSRKDVAEGLQRMVLNVPKRLLSTAGGKERQRGDRTTSEPWIVVLRWISAPVPRRRVSQ